MTMVETLQNTGTNLVYSDRVHADAVTRLVQPIENRLAELTTPGSYLNDIFYSESTIDPLPLRAVPTAFGKELLIQDETQHAAQGDDGEHFAVPTFKFRGALVSIAQAVREKPGLHKVVAASAGNHALGVAAAANILGLDAEIHLPEDASPVKKERVRNLGADVVDCYTSLAAALKGAQLKQDANRTTVHAIHPFAHPDVIAGQATVGYEMLQSLYMREKLGLLNLHEDEVTILSPVGGGGLATGIAVAVKRARDAGRIGGTVRFVPVQIENKEHNAWSDGTRTGLGYIASEVLADQRYADEMLTASEMWVAEAMLDLRANVGKMIEPAGALALAGALQLGATKRAMGYEDRTTYVVPVTGSGVTTASFAHAYDLHFEAYLSEVDLPSLTSRFIYDTDDTERVSTAVGNHASGLLSQNQYGPYYAR